MHFVLSREYFGNGCSLSWIMGRIREDATLTVSIPHNISKGNNMRPLVSLKRTTNLSRGKYYTALSLLWVYSLCWVGSLVWLYATWERVGYVGYLLVLLCAIASPDIFTLFESYSKFSERQNRSSHRME